MEKSILDENNRKARALIKSWDTEQVDAEQATDSKVKQKNLQKALAYSNALFAHSAREVPSQDEDEEDPQEPKFASSRVYTAAQSEASRVARLSKLSKRHDYMDELK
jgi:hypothetical protein